ncbi:MAG: hypothetical protein IK136_01910, partial [Oscillospiraceae bacterium]|nr:hypothetical protein [Oscillospiraceae bacterium]
AAELYECIAQDMDEGTIGRIWLCCGEEYENTVYDGYISITLRLPEGEDRYFDFSTTPTKDAVHTDEFLRAHGIELLTVREEQELDQYGPYGPRAVYA